MGINFLSSHTWIGQKKDLHFPNLLGVAFIVVDICVFSFWCYKFSLKREDNQKFSIGLIV
jgi:hypothetical protein